jgi:WD40 repeat protein/predicted Ser/Thr protein kinase
MEAPQLTCTACGHANPPGSRYCNACGSPLGLTRRLGDATTGTPPDAVIAQAPPAVRAPIPPEPPPDAELAAGTAIDPAGRYVVERSVGRGGFGQAYLVYDRQLSRYAVAKRQVPNPAWSARTREAAASNFRREAQLLVTLNTPGHPNIPEIFEFLPEQNFLVMKYVEGQDLGQLLRERGGSLPPAEALAIARDVASALSYMHARRPEHVLHRDVKPSNIIIDSAGRVWLIDFGLSRSAPLDVELDPRHTQLAGTLGFTPPEQWRGKASPRSDIFALSVTLHMALTGFTPTLTRADLPDFLRGAKNPFPPVRSLNPAIHPEIETLVARGLAFKPEDRPTAAELLAALEKILAPAARANLQSPSGEAIVDEHALALWAERNWEAAANWLYTNLPEQVERMWGRNKLGADMRAIVARHPGDQNAGLDDLLAALDPGGFGAESPRLAGDRRSIDFGGLGLDERRDEWLQISNPGRRYVRLSVESPRWVVPSLLSLSLLPGRQQRLKLTADMRRVSESGRLKGAVLLKDRAGSGFRVELQAQLSRWRAFWLRTVAGQRALDWEGGSVRSVRTINAHRGGVWALDFSPMGQQLASGGWDSAVRLWRVADGGAAATLDERAGNVLSVNFSPDGLLLAATSSDEQVKIWGARGGKLVQALSGQRGYQESAHFSPDGHVLVTNGSDSSVRYWRVTDGSLLARVAVEGGGVAMACRPDGAVIAVGCGDRRVRLYDWQLGELKATLDGHRDGVSCLTYSLDGSLLATGSADGVVCLWDGESGELRRQLRGHSNAVRSVALHPDGLVVATGGVDGSIRLWRTSDGALCQVLNGHSSGVLRITFSPNGELLASGGGDGAITFWQPS